jgi:hypothetical protein
MNKIFKYIVSAIAGVALFATTVSAQINSPSPTPAFTTNLTISNPTDTLLVSNACKIAQVSVIGVGLTTVNIYDNNFTNTTYTNVAYTNVTQYASNIVSSFVSPLTGTTNTQTNTLWFETNVVVAAATNNLPFRTFIAPNGIMSTYNIDMIMVKGILVTSSSTNGQVLITYRNNN